MEQAQLEVPGTVIQSIQAREWLNWGQELKKPCRGCVVVFERGGGGHVAFYDREEGDNIYVLGGNQNNQVNIAPYPKSRKLGYRWPKGLPVPEITSSSLF